MDRFDHYNALSLSQTQVEDAIKLLETLSENSSLLASISEPQRIALFKAAGKISRPDRKEKKERNKEIKKAIKAAIVQKERSIRAQTGIRVAREAAVFELPKQISDTSSEQNKMFQELSSPRNCYVCKAEYSRLHFFYDQMCPECAELNYRKRYQSAPLHGQIALITGSRVKIGYQSTLKLLRAGATVIATTRFPVDSAMRFSRESDYNEWKDRLHIFGLDLRHTPSVEIFCSFIEQSFDRLDILINNAAQTVRRPPAFYAHLMENELRHRNQIPGTMQNLLGSYYSCIDHLNSFSQKTLASERALPVTWDGKVTGMGLSSSAQLSMIPYSHDTALSVETVFPQGALDADLQQVDLRTTNSWRYTLGEIQTSEMLELQLVNSVAPFVLCNRLVKMMKRENTGCKHIVNVSAMEGKFMRFEKGDRHPHTNMAKAALNMLTHTSASGLAKVGIFMNAVDTGWVTDEDPAVLAKKKQELHDFQPPLDIVDGAARVCDPFFDGILTGKHWCGKFLKDYFPIDW